MYSVFCDIHVFPKFSTKNSAVLVLLKKLSLELETSMLSQHPEDMGNREDL